ncbi:MAG: hypothetical protein IPN71_06200 [Fibrobacteres bacterium]|nr:hypothetical protein [Fibrobacterota bacterium]
MKILSDNLKDSPEIQAYFYDCLKAAHDRMATLAHSEEQAEYPWRTGANQVNVVGVRGICKGVVRSKNLNGWMDDTIYVARINQNGNKEVAEFNASLDYSSGKAPILMEGCYKYRFGIHKQSSYEFKKSDMDDVNIYSRYTDQDLFPEKYRMVKKDPAGADLVDQNGEKIYETKLAKLGLSMVNRFVFDEDTFDTDNVETRNLNEFNLNHRRTLLSASSYKRRTYYRALVSGNSLLGRDANQNNIIDPGETLGWEGDQGIHIHYGGEENEVETNSAGCHVIHGWSEYKRFMALIE